MTSARVKIRLNHLPVEALRLYRNLRPLIGRRDANLVVLGFVCGRSGDDYADFDVTEVVS